MMNIVDDVKALRDLTESVLLGWLAIESPSDRRRQKALELLADAGQNLHVACINLGAIDQIEENESIGNGEVTGEVFRVRAITFLVVFHIQKQRLIDA